MIDQHDPNWKSSTSRQILGQLVRTPATAQADGFALSSKAYERVRINHPDVRWNLLTSRCHVLLCCVVVGPVRYNYPIMRCLLYTTGSMLPLLPDKVFVHLDQDAIVSSR